MFSEKRNKIALSEIYKPIEKDLVKVEEELGRQLRSKNRFLSQIGNYILRGAGKRLRPALILLSAKAFSFSEGSLIRKQKQLTPLACAIELIHTATLIHDDIIDKAALRRKKPTLNAKWGEDIAILFGDYLHSNASGLLSSLNLPQLMLRLSSVIKEMCQGEIEQLKTCFNLSLSEEKYLDIIRKKTARLFSFSCKKGAFFGGADPNEESVLADYGLNFGMAYQIIDDCLDIIGQEKKAGKSLGSDVRRGKLTLPLITLIGSLPEKERKETAKLLWHRETSSAELKEKLEESKAIDYAFDKAKKYLERAKRKIKRLKGSPAKESLLNLADYTMARVY